MKNRHQVLIVAGYLLAALPAFAQQSTITGDQIAAQLRAACGSMAEEAQAQGTPRCVDQERFPPLYASFNLVESLEMDLKAIATTGAAVTFCGGLDRRYWACLAQARIQMLGGSGARLRTGSPVRAAPAVGAAAGRVDSGTAPGLRERREACGDLARARRVAEREFDEWVSDCTALAALAVPSVKVLPPELAFDNGGKCVTVSAAKQRIVNGEIETTVALRNSCPVPQLVYAQLKPMAGATLYSAPIWTGPTLPRQQMWPVNNAMPKLPYVPTFERDSGFIINSGTTWTTAVRQNLQSVGDIGVKVGACDSITPARKPRTAFRAADFSGFNCFDIPPAELSNNEKEWQKLLKDPRPIGPQPKKKPTPPPAAKKKGGE